MKTIRAIRGQKELIESGGWQSGKMPRTCFPLSKNKSFTLGAGWDWRVFTLQSGSDVFRLLVAFRSDKEQYLAWLGLKDGDDQALLARLEFHPSHHGWHCHIKPSPTDLVTRGVVKQPREKTRLCNGSDKFGVTKLDAAAIAFRIFNVQPQVIAGELFQ